MVLISIMLIWLIANINFDECSLFFVVLIFPLILLLTWPFSAIIIVAIATELFYKQISEDIPL